MKFPSATYRLQFRNGMDFDRACRLVPYLADLGISHLYASPVATAVTGSTHGYDVTRPNEIDPAIGGLDGLRRFAEALHARGLGLILDIVPNHMAASLENPWWRSVVALGEESPYARYFDIDWSERLTLPFLGHDFDHELTEGTIALALDPRHGDLALNYYEHFFPLHPRTHTLAGDATDAETLAAISRDRARLAAIHDAQPWRLTEWTTAARHLSYRRFFEITGLVGLRAEDETVFSDAHRLVLDLVEDGTVDGLRIDHVDGLADPRAYLDRLRAAVGPEVYIVVEKILEKDEALPAGWPVEGTTGYEFIAALSEALVDEREGGRLMRAFSPLRPAGQGDSYEAARRAAKRKMLTQNFAGETAYVTGLAMELAGGGIARETLAEAIRAFIVALPIYRTYATAEGADAQDRERVRAVCAEAKRDTDDAAVHGALDILSRLLLDTPGAGTFRARFQQLSGPIMAKALEDTLFYRENAFIALNEVGGDPGRPTEGVAAFHAAMRARAERMPHGLSATSTHDTKRGEDARARLYALSEAPETWISAVRRWQAGNAPRRRDHGNGPVPEPAVEWLVYQALAGIWPVEGLAGRSAGDLLGTRMRGYMEKALREAKLATDWTRPDVDYERKVVGFVDDLLADADFCADFEETLSPFIEAGMANTLAQLVLKLTAPGIPDLYQGSERCDFSLVDPDNRAAIDPDALAVPREKPPFGRTSFRDHKQWLAATLLRARRGAPPGLFDGPYLPLDTDRHALAFLRGTPAAFAIAVVPRLTYARTLPAGIKLRLPAAFADRAVTNLLDGQAGRTAATFTAEPLAVYLSAEA